MKRLVFILILVLAGCNGSSPNGKHVTAKHFVPEHYEACSSPHILSDDDHYSCLIDDDWNVTLEGYGIVPVSNSCFDTIKVGDTWKNDWKFECK